MKRWKAPSVRQLAWAGGLVIAALATEAVYEVWSSYRARLRSTEVELSAQARVIAEQTARGVQAVDIVLKNLADQLRDGPLAQADADGLHRALRRQAEDLVQSDGLVLIDADGRLRAVSQMALQKVPSGTDLSNESPYRRLREQTQPGLIVDQVRRSPGTGRWVFPMARRLDDSQGRFAGVIGAAGQVGYFESFYRDTYPEPSTRIALMRNSGELLARHPRVESMYGQKLEVLQRILPPGEERQANFVRVPSPIDGRDHFAAVRRVPGYPLVVAVTRSGEAVIGPWRDQAIATLLRTLLLGGLAGVLLWLALRQLSRTQAARLALEVSQERYALAAAGSDVGVWDWDLQSGQAYESRRARELLGLAPQPEIEPIAALEEQLKLSIHAQDWERRAAALQSHLAGRTSHYELEMRILDGRGDYRWVHVRALCIRDAQGRPVRLAGSVSDIDARKRAERALQQSDERYALAMAGSRAGHWVWNVASDELYVSEQYNELLGLPPGNQLGKREDFFNAVQAAPEDIARVRQLSSELVAGQRERAEHEFRVQTAQGERWVLTRAQRFADDAGGLRIAGVSVDVTERKQAELERQRLEEQLRQAQKLEAIGTLAGGIAHDFNNILAGILGYGEMAQKEAPPGSSLRRHVDAAMSAGQRAKSLVERILAFSRSGVGQRVPVHVQSVVQEALEALQSSLPAGVRLEAALQAGDAGVMGDPTQIHQVVMNLCLNAAQSMRSEGLVRVSLELEDFDAPQSLATAQLPAGSYLRLIVEDSGAGMPESLLSRIFDPFFTTKEVGVGTGLGLSLVHGIVSDLGGGIAVQSRLGEGSCFTVYLPLRAGGVVRPAQRSASAAMLEPGRGECVLVVDDEEPLVRLAEELLAELGYEPVGFSSALSALQALRQDPGRFDLLLSDESMPSMTGTQLVAQARALAPQLPVVLMSGFVTQTLQTRARELGILQVLNKPLMAAEIAAALAAALRANRRSKPS